MRKLKKAAISAIAALLAVLTVLPSEAAYAADSAGKDTNVVSWNSTLPAYVDGKYDTDTGWYRLVLEYGNYSTNQSNSNGEYTGRESESGSDSTANSWPEKAWSNNLWDAYSSLGEPRDWPGKYQSLKVDSCTAIKESDQALYSKNEYSQDGLYSLYVKCAGYDETNEQWMYYISPCDSNGERQQRLWMLDFCLNLAIPEVYPDIYYMILPTEGYYPEVNLIMPTFEQIKNENRLHLAGVSLPYSWETGSHYNGLPAEKVKQIAGKLVADYYDNEKWYIIQNEDGSWTIKSAGHIEWDWTKSEYGWAEFYDDPTEALAQGLGNLSYATALYYYDQTIEGNSWVPGADGIYGKAFYNFYYTFWGYRSGSATAVKYSRAMSAALHSIMLFLSDYAENLYITGGYIHRECSYFDDEGENIFDSGYFSNVDKTVTTGNLNVSYGMEFTNSLTLEQVQALISKDTSYYKSYSGDDPLTHALDDVYKELGIQVKVQEGSLSTVEPVYRTCTVDEVKATLPISFTSCWQPSKGKGAFTGLYVGKIMKTDLFNSGNEKNVTIESGTAVSLGATDKDGDGFCDAGAYITSLLGNEDLSGIRQLKENFTEETQWQALWKGLFEDQTVMTLNVEDGAVLNIEGPTFTVAGITLVVKGNLNISPGAMLCPENLDGDNLSYIGKSFINLIIDGGEVYVSDGAMLDVGYGNITVKNGGSLVNDGVVVHSTDLFTEKATQIRMEGGIIKNGISAWFVSGAEVRGKSRMTMIRGALNNSSLANLSKYISSVSDTALGRFTGEAYKYTTLSSAGTQPALQMSDNKEFENSFQNSGYALFVGGIRNTGTKDKSTFMNGGSLYRSLDIWNGNYYSGTIPDSSFSYYAKYTGQTNLTADKEPRIVAFNELYNINYVEGGVYVDEDADTKAQKDNLLALKVGTGSQGSEYISRFKITYVDISGNERCEYVSPSKLINTYYYVLNCDYCGTAEDQKGDSKLITPTGGTVLSAESSSRGLESYSNVVYLFQSTAPVSYVKCISFTGTASGSWTCTELGLYKVRYLYPLEEYGYYSEDWYLPFTGDLLAEAALKNEKNGMKSYTFAWDQETVEIGTGLYQLNVYGAPNSVKTQTDISGFSYYNVSHDSKSYTTQDADYIFSVSLADADEAGIEKLYNVASNVTLENLMNDAGFVKSITDDIKLDMNFTYLDTTGSARRITIPFTQSAIDWAYRTMVANNDTDSCKGALHGLFQQGEDIAFKGKLPDFSSVYEMSVTYRDDGSTIAVTAASLSSSSYADVAVRDGKLIVDYPESALYFYCAPSADGVKINNGQTMNMSVKAWNGTENLKPSAKGSRYLVVVQTDSMMLAGTVNDLSAKFSYKTVNGMNFTTSTYALRSLVKNYYGYWLSDDGTNSECAYETATRTGQQMYFVLDLENVYEFTSATFTLGKPKTDAEKKSEETEELSEDITENEPPLDAWQMSAITVYELDELGERQVILGSGITTDEFATNRTYYRDNVFSRRGAISRAKGKLLIAPGETKTISFEDGGIENSTTTVNEATRIKSLSYVDALQDFGFNTRRVRYDLEIKVSGDSITSAEDGDCGSKNQFYFQLVFQDDSGNLYTSPCVLANQQLKSDGFRTGTKEYMSIYTNDDYGTPVQINIIPDDTSSASDVFDKLCVEYVNVSKTSSTGVSQSWTADKVGWIDIEYKDDAEEQTGRSASQLIRSFDLVEGGYDVRLEFGIETGAEYADGQQFIGQVTADITYRDSTGALDTKYNVAIVSLIADYADREGSLQKVEVEGTDVSLSEFMFKRGYTNRFQYTFHNISTLVSVKFNIKSEDNRSLKINKVFARQVYDEGTLSYNIFNEYERYYQSDPQDLATTNNTNPMTISGLGGTGTGTLNFSSGNSVVIDLTPGEESIDVETGETEGKNDKISITAELADTTGIYTGATLPIQLIYKNVYGDAFSVKSTLVFDADSGMFMIPGDSLPKTPDIGMPYQVEITGTGYDGREIMAVKVNQLRDGEVLETFLFAPAAGTKLSAAESTILTISDSEQDEYAKRKGYTNETQTVYLKLGASTEKTLLTESQDLQLALVYTEKDDPYNYEHVSDYISLLDCGYTVINSNSTLEIPLNVKNVGTVSAIRLRTSADSVKVNAEKGCIALVENSNMTGSVIASGWANLPTATGMISSSDNGTLMSTDGRGSEQALTSPTRISPVNVNLECSSIARSDAIVKVTVGYKNSAGVLTAYSGEQKASEWNREGTWFLIDGVSGLYYYAAEVYDKDGNNTATVTLGDMEIGWYSDTGEYITSSITSGTTLTEGNAVAIPIVSSKLTGKAVYGTTTLKLEDNLVTNGRIDYATVTLKASTAFNISASLPGYNGELEAVLVNTATGSVVAGPVSTSASAETLSGTIMVPVNRTSSNVVYELIVRSKSAPALYSAKVCIVMVPEARIEGIIVPQEGNSTTFSTTQPIILGTDILNQVIPLSSAGDVVTIYARTVNISDELLYSLDFQGFFGDTCDGSTYSVKVSQNCTVPGMTGTYTKYEITVGEAENAQICKFRVYSSVDADLSCQVQFFGSYKPQS